MEMAIKGGSERFQNDAGKYAAYLETPEGRLRLDLAFANLQEFLPASQSKAPLSALDIGCGTGAIAVRLARLGIHVTLLDSSSSMLSIAQHAALEAGVSDSIALKQGDADQLANLFPMGSFDVILCHNVLEYVDDPGAVLRGAVRLMRGPSAVLSLLARNQAGEALKAALQAGDLAAAEKNLSAEWGTESLYGGKVRLLTLDQVRTMLTATSFDIMAERGVRVIVDYLPPNVSRTDCYEQILGLERKLGSRTEFAAAARYVHCLARRANQAIKDGT